MQVQEVTVKTFKTRYLRCGFKLIQCIALYNFHLQCVSEARMIGSSYPGICLDFFMQKHLPKAFMVISVQDYLAWVFMQSMLLSICLSHLKGRYMNLRFKLINCTRSISYPVGYILQYIRPLSLPCFCSTWQLHLAHLM